MLCVVFECFCACCNVYLNMCDSDEFDFVFTHVASVVIVAADIGKEWKSFTSEQVQLPLQTCSKQRLGVTKKNQTKDR